ncbi:S-adenosyl-L-methionine-dependent methyltransferase [Xylaria digitata]|nr:S-adenosyl-L-methionine-dependent methyltransferase [Xylaria digitata]
MSTSLLTRTTEAFWGLVGPWLFLSISASFVPKTIKHIFRTHGFLSGLRVLLSPSRFREAWFGQFWAVVGPNVRDSASDKVLPLLDGRTSQGRVVEKPTGPGVGGVVIEIGAATGLYVEVFSDRHLYEDDSAGAKKQRGPNGLQKRANTARSKITRVYGVEPNAAHHAALRRSVEAAGLKDVYEVVPVGIEDLSSSSGDGKKKWEGNIEPGSVDCIVSVLCLCSIPDPERHIRELYELLRPGGRWYVYEHVKIESSWYMQLYQRFINIAWQQAIGGCQLCRPTEKTLREAGPWTNIDVGRMPDEQWFHCVPHILGVFTK